MPDAILYPNGETMKPRVTSSFGPRRSPGGIGSRIHQGVDLVGYYWNRAVTSGTVLRAGYFGGFGNLVEVDHGVIRGRRVVIRQAHGKTETIQVRKGQRVVPTQRLSVMGMTGTATGIHCHVEVLLDGVHVDPEQWFRENVRPATVVSKPTPSKPSGTTTPATPPAPSVLPKGDPEMQILHNLDMSKEFPGWLGVLHGDRLVHIGTESDAEFVNDHLGKFVPTIPFTNGNHFIKTCEFAGIPKAQIPTRGGVAWIDNPKD